MSGFLANNNINVTALCFEVDFTKDDLFFIKASPQFWQFVLSENKHRTIKVVDSFDYRKYGATTCVRLAFKAFEMQHFKFDMGELDPLNGTLAISQKNKLDKMKNWDDSPLKDFECKKKKNQNCYCLVAKEQQVKHCADSRSRCVSKRCSVARCKKCCVKHCIKHELKCKCKDHVTAMDKELAKAVEAGVLVDGFDVNVGDAARDKSSGGNENDIDVNGNVEEDAIAG